MKSKRVRKNRYKNRKSSHGDGLVKWRSVIGIAAKIIGVILFVMGMSLIFMFGHDMITQSDYFKAEKIIVTGNSRLSIKEIKKITDIHEGVNILSVNLVVARKKLMANPWIRSVDIRRDYPAVMEIHVVENHPRAIVDFGRFFLINSMGNVFMEAEPSDFPDLPVISGIEYSQWNQEQGPTRAFRSVMSVLNIVDKGVWPFKPQALKQIDVDTETGVTLLTETAVEKIRLGFGKYKEKIRRLAKILSLPEKIRRFSDFYMMDLRNPERVVARPRPIIEKGGVR